MNISKWSATDFLETIYMVYKEIGLIYIIISLKQGGNVHRFAIRGELLERERESSKATNDK